MMTILDQLRDVPRAKRLRMSKDVYLLIGNLAHNAADEIERLTRENNDMRRSLYAAQALIVGQRGGTVIHGLTDLMPADGSEP